MTSARRLAIGLVGQGWHPDLGGVESHTRDLARELAARAHRVAAFALDTGAEREPYSLERRVVEGVALTRLAYRYHDQRALADLVRSPRAEEALVAWAASERLDLVHVHHASGLGLGILPALRARGFAVVMTLHDYWPLCPRGQMLRTDGALCARAEPARCAPCLAATWPHLMPSRSGEPRGPGREPLASDEDAARARTEHALLCLLAAHRLFTPSAAARAVYAAHGLAPERIQVVENGIDVQELARAVAELRARRPARDELRLGVLGTVLPSKGALELARAFQEARLPRLTLEIHGNLPGYHGDGSYVEALRRLAVSDPRIRVHGPFAHDALPAILADVDGVAAPSRWTEVYGLTVREARAAGLPVLVSSAGALPDVVADGQGGLVVPAEDRAAWIAALRRFADPAQRAAWTRERGLPRAAGEMAAELEHAYREVLAELRGGPRGWLRRLLGRR